MLLIMSVYEIATIIISGLTLIATIAISFVLYFLNNKHREEEKRLKNEQLAKSFIIDNNEINDYIPLCVLASALNRHKKHYRQLYNEYNKLSDEVQKEVIRQCNYDIELVKGVDWVSNSIDYVNNFINDNDLGNGRNNYLYDDGKYIHCAIDNFPNCEYDGRSYNKKYRNPFPNKKIGFEDNIPVEYPIDFDTYCEYYMSYVVRSSREESKLYKVLVPKPIEYLENVEDLFNTNIENVCYWVLDFVSFFAVYIINTPFNRYPNEYVSDVQVETYEDKYYDVMLDLYLLYKIVICKESKE